MDNMNIGKTFGGFYKNKTVFVTGHTGFHGSWLSLWLKSLGAIVIGFSLEPPTKPSMFKLLQLEKQITHLIGDIRDKDLLHRSLLKYNPEIIFHLAAQPLVLESFERPIETFSTNILGTANLLECARNISNLKVCIVYTSDKCYAHNENLHAFTENDPLGGNDPYSASKAAAEIITTSYRNSFFNIKNTTNLATIRAGNVMGGGDWAKYRLVPDCMRALISNKKIKIRNPNAIRPWQYVLEPLSGMLDLTIKMWNNSNYSESWNFGPDLVSEDITVRKIATQIATEWQSDNVIELENNSKNNNHEENYLKIDSSKAKKRLGWKPVYSLNNSIRETVKWYKSFSGNKINMNEFTLKQINNYVSKAKEQNLSWTAT